MPPHHEHGRTFGFLAQCIKLNNLLVIHEPRTWSPMTGVHTFTNVIIGFVCKRAGCAGSHLQLLIKENIVLDQPTEVVY